MYFEKTPPECSRALREYGVPIFNITSLDRSVSTMWAKSGAGHILIDAAGSAGRWFWIYGRCYYFSDHWATSVHRQNYFFVWLWLLAIQLSMANLIYLFIIKCQEKLKYLKIKKSLWETSRLYPHSEDYWKEELSDY